MKLNPGIGATPDLSLRVSVATLVRVVFRHPRNDEWMLALERKATLHELKAEVKSQPFGGAIRILDSDTIRDWIGDFHFDSERSRSEQDFRIFIRPSSWSAIRAFCIEHFSRVNDPILETDPSRELAEEFADALKISLKPEQYTCRAVETIIEAEAAPTGNFHTRGYSTVRIYRVFEAVIRDSALIDAILENTELLSDQDLCELAIEDAENGGNGWANAVLVLPLNHIYAVYQAMPPKERNAPILFEQNLLDDTVSAILEGVSAPKYQRA